MGSAKPGESRVTDRWRGKWALVTGASAGIGSALARNLAGGGCNLVLTARRRERMDELASELIASYGIAAEIVTDHHLARNAEFA